PLVGGGLQHRGHPARGRGAAAMGDRPPSCGRRGADVAVHGDRGHQRPAPAPRGSVVRPGVPDHPRETCSMSYKRFAAMIGTSTVVMFGLMFSTVYRWEHLHWSQTRFWMA